MLFHFLLFCSKNRRIYLTKLVVVAKLCDSGSNENHFSLFAIMHCGRHHSLSLSPWKKRKHLQSVSVTAVLWNFSLLYVIFLLIYFIIILLWFFHSANDMCWWEAFHFAVSYLVWFIQNSWINFFAFWFFRVLFFSISVLVSVSLFICLFLLILVFLFVGFVLCSLCFQFSSLKILVKLFSDI